MTIVWGESISSLLLLPFSNSDPSRKFTSIEAWSYEHSCGLPALWFIDCQAKQSRRYLHIRNFSWCNWL